jgi:hypothetical protein
VTATDVTPTPARRSIGPDLAIAAAALVLFAFAFAVSFSWPDAAARFPRMASGMGVLFSLSVLAVVLFGRRRAAPGGPTPESGEAGAEGGSGRSEDPGDAEYVFATAGAGAWLRALGWVAGYLLLLVAYGLFTASGVFAVLYLRFCGRRSWLFSVVYAAVLVLVLLASFRWFVHVPVPQGFIRFA